MDYSKLNGLIPAVIQDADSNEVLMVGFMNDKALARTRETGFATFFSKTFEGMIEGRPMILVHDGLNCFRRRITEDPGDLGRRQRELGKALRIRGPGHDVDALAIQLVDDGLHP